MSRHQVAIGSDSPLRRRVVIDGTDIAKGLAGLTVHVHAGEVPRVELDVHLTDVSRLGSVEAEVALSAGSHEALVALGWTPPADG
ncbi:hypothetical protein [Streptomyces sp. NPDC059970]|uniref:hypothetical protein n=1 Tax=Streptomyces sp. NPDC059970 TaxID=3347019 RepID=UPI00369FB937